MTYQPAEDSFLLSRHLSEHVKGKIVLDMGAGSGIQTETAIKSKAKSIIASDINNEAVKYLKNKFKSYQQIKITKSDLFSQVKGRFDVIAFNPPYLPKDNREDAESARATTGGKKGDEIILSFLRKVKKHMEKDGSILLIVSSLTPQTRIDSLIKKLRLKKKIIGREKLFMETLELWEITLYLAIKSL